MVKRPVRPVDSRDKMLPDRPEALETDRAAQRHCEQRPFASRPHVEGRCEKDEDAGEHLGELKRPEKLRLGHNDRDAGITKKEQHQPKAARPEKAPLPPASPE